MNTLKNNLNPLSDLKSEAMIFTSTRNSTWVFEEKEKISKKDIDFKSVLPHLNIHISGEVNGSQFDGKVFSNPEEIMEKVVSNLPSEIPFDEFGRSEITLKFSKNVWFTGISSIEDLKTTFTYWIRNPWGEEWEYNWLKGAWYPEMAQNPETGKFEVVRNSDWEVANPKFKFEPKLYLAEVPELSSTDEITVILQKWDNSETKARALTCFPGENAPSVPTYIGKYWVDTTAHDSLESKYWREHAFLKVNINLLKSSGRVIHNSKKDLTNILE